MDDFQENVDDFNNMDGQNLTDFIYNEMNPDIKKSDLIENLDYFNNNFQAFFAQEEPKKYAILRDIRKTINVSEDKAIKFFQRNTIIDEFVNRIVKTNQSTNKMFNIEILRIFNRLSQVYEEFLNPSNIKEFNSLMRIRTSQEEDPLVRHYALICIGKIVHQSKLWAEKILELYEFIFDAIDCEFDSKNYYNHLEQDFKELLDSLIGEKNNRREYYKISRKKGDPYIYAIHGIIKQLVDSDRLKNIIIVPEDRKNIEDIKEYNIVITTLKYLETSKRNDTIDIFTACNQIEILNDIVHVNHQGTFHVLKICEFILDLFFRQYIEMCSKIMFFDLYVPIMELIGSFYKNGKQYIDFFQDFDFEFVSNALLLESVDININTAAACCMFDIINLTKGDGVNLFFEKDEKYEKFLKFIDITINENTPYRKKIVFYSLSGLIFQNYIWSKIDFDVNSFISAALDSMDQEDNDLTLSSLSALSSLYIRIQEFGSTEEFNDYFIKSDGKAIIERLVIDENTTLPDQAIFFLKSFSDGFNE